MRALFRGSLSGNRESGPAQNKFWTVTMAFLHRDQSFQVLSAYLPEGRWIAHQALLLINSQGTRPT